MNEQYVKVLFTTLLANMPKDTRNMMTQTRMIGTSDIGTHWKITITAPYATHIDTLGKAGDYAYEVNYNPRRSAKEVRNYKYVERNIKQVAHLFGLGVSNL